MALQRWELTGVTPQLSMSVLSLNGGESMQRKVSQLLLGLILVCSLFGSTGIAQTPPATASVEGTSQRVSNEAAQLAGGAAASPEIQARLATIEQNVTDARNAGDNAWMLVCAALVLMMTGPGLALFYGGLVRKKNVLATMMQSFILMAVVTVLWAVFGYSLVFHEGNRFIGGLGYMFLHGVGAAPDPDYAETFPSKPSWCISSCSPSSRQR